MLKPTTDPTTGAWVRTWARALALPTTAFALALLLYGQTLALPYFWDDFPHYAFATTRTFLQLWTDVTGLPYYRPVMFTINKIVFTLLPPGLTWPPHLLALAVHAANGVLAGGVAAQVSGAPSRAQRQAVAWCVALLFVALPFGALPVPHWAAANHPLVTLFILVGALAVCRQIEQPGARRWALLAAGAALLAPYTHEAGIVAGAVLASVAVCCNWRWARRHWPWLLVLVMLSAAYWPVWRAIPKTQADGPLIAPMGLDTLLAKLAFFIQALTYPVQPLSTAMITRLGWWDIGVVLGVGGLALVAVGWLLVRRGAGRLLGLALAWTTLTMLPSAVALSYDYIIISPRLLYFPGVGGAVVWGGAVVALAWTARQPALRWAMAGAALAAVGLVGGVYVWREADLYRLALTPLEQFIKLAAAAPDESQLVINTTNWMSYRQQWYPLGHDGVPVLAPYLNFFQLVYTNSGWLPAGTTATFPDLLPQLNDHFLATANEEAGEQLDVERFTELALGYDRVWFTRYTDTRAQVDYVGGVTAAPAQPPVDYQARFGPGLYLTDSAFMVADGTATVRLHWAFYGPNPDATVFRHVFDCAGNLLGEGSGLPLRGMLSFGYLPAPAGVDDVRAIPLAMPSPDGCYQVNVGLFKADGSRVPAFDRAGTELPNALFVVP